MIHYSENAPRYVFKLYDEELDSLLDILAHLEPDQRSETFRHNLIAIIKDYQKKKDIG